MKYLGQSFTLPTCTTTMTQLEYDLRVGNITQQEFDQLSTSQLTNVASAPKWAITT